MLYERWRRVARERRDELALTDLASGRNWTFGALDRLTEVASPAARSMVFPQGHTPEFVLDVLRAWRTGAIVCPLESGQALPSVPRPPPPCGHLKSTSATTGAPRWVAFTGPQLAADADNIVLTMGLRPEWPNLGVISMAHSYGYSNLVLPLLLHGIPLVLAPSALPEVVHRAAKRFSALTLAGVPALWRAWHEARAVPRTVRLAVSAGAPLPVALEREVFDTCGLKLHNFYGATECGGIAYDRSPRPRRTDAAVGTPMENVRLSLNHEQCLCVHSRAVGQTYWPEPSETLRSGRLQTADLAEIRGGRIYLHGRAADLINVAGRKLSPETVESVLGKHPSVRDCVVFGLPNAEGDRAEVVGAAVASREPVTGETLRRFLLERLPAWQVPRQWAFVESLLTDARGKVSRTEWRRRVIAQARSGHRA